MTDLIARFFRWNNSRLIGSKSLISEKFLKLFFYLSVVIYRINAPGRGSRSQSLTIENFDSDIKINVDRGKTMGSAIYWTGFHEFREFLFLDRFLKPEMVFIDIGANVGEYSLFAAKRLKGGQVLAFEPLPLMQHALRKNIDLNGFDNIKVFSVGLSARPETLLIHEFEDVHEGLATFYPGERRSHSTHAVKLEKLDDVIKGCNLTRVDFIKLDIEGGELKALEGSRSVIAKYRPVILIEVNQSTYTAAGYTIEDVLSFFREVRYKPYQIKRRGYIQLCEVLPSFGNILFRPQ